MSWTRPTSASSRSSSICRPGLALKDPQGNFLIVNGQYGVYLGFDARNAIGSSQSFDGSVAAAEIARLDGAALLSAGPEQAEIEIIGEQDTRVVVATSFPILYSGTAIGVGTSLVDVTARCQAERELILAKEAAEAGNRAKSEFLAAIQSRAAHAAQRDHRFFRCHGGGIFGPPRRPDVHDLRKGYRRQWPTSFGDHQRRPRYRQE